MVSGGIFIAGLANREFLWRVVVALEGFANGVGRVAAWAGLLLVLQQIMVIFLQGIFRVSDIGLGPAARIRAAPRLVERQPEAPQTRSSSCSAAPTPFVQGGHVRVDLFYAGARYRTKRAIDMVGALVFMIPALLRHWHYAWFFIVAPPREPQGQRHPTRRGDAPQGAGVSLAARDHRLFAQRGGSTPISSSKVLIVVFALMMLVQALAVFYRAYLEFTGGEGEAGRGLDRDRIEPGEVEMAGPQDLAHGGRR